MLRNLQINNFLLFQEQEVIFNEKLTVITGETGSGKSMLIKTLRFVLGEKVDNLESIDKEMSVIAQFVVNKRTQPKLFEILEENDISIEEDDLILRRVLTSNNRGKIFINDVLVSLNFLKRVSNELVEFHSQHKQLEAFNQSNCLNIIDQFANQPDLLEQVSRIYQQITILSKEIEDAYKEKQELEKDKDYIEHGFQEIQGLNLKLGEELELIEKKRLFNDKIKVISSVENLITLFTKEENIIQKLIRVQREITKLEIGLELEELLENSINYLSELESSAEKKLKALDTEENIESIEERLSKIKELSRKYKCTSDQLLNIREEYQQKLERLAKISSEIETKNSIKEKLLKEYFVIAESLSALRKQIAKQLEKKIIAELKELKLEQVEFEIELTADTLRPITIKGIDQAKFLIKTNKGFVFAQVHEIASGGELSRIMLAFKVALAQSNQKTTIIFDEIDAGTGGAVAETIGKRLKKLSDSNQIITISHQPQVASKANQHLLVQKLTLDQKSKTFIKDLNKEEKLHEIARMLAGINISDSAIAAARSLIEN